jgi:hypothetical protein
MKNGNVVPFPAPAETLEPNQRVVVTIGKQRIALDIACRAALLSPPAQHVCNTTICRPTCVSP